MKRPLTIVLFSIFVLLALFGYFYIPILTSFGVEFPRTLLWALSIFPTVILFNLPLIIYIYMLRREQKRKQ